VTLHSRSYLVPRRPTVVICVDGFDPSYLQKGIEDGIIPTFSSFAHNGFHETAKVAMPSFTNPNNVSIITGVPPAIHGIAGNYFLDRETGKEIMIVDDKLLRGSTILEQMSKVGVRIAAVTAKDKLRKILTHGLTLDKNASVCFSAEKAGSCTLEENGISDVEEFVGRPQPPQFSGELSLFVLDAGIRLLEQDRTDLFYLTLSDFIQHTHAPREEESDEFYAALDARVARLVELGAKVAITGDHGMSGKCGADGKPDVVFLQDEIEARFGQGCCRVICPITDPFVRHHAGLGSLVRIYVDKNRTQDVDAMIQFCRNFSQVQIAVSGAEAAEEYEMPLDREGDIVVIASHHAVIGATRKDHNLDDIKDHKLRSHGGLSEAHVPLMMSEPMQHDASSAGRQWRNFDIFDLVLN
ncbi:Phosphonoacetate hydrolase, partial [Lophium mytilinum]